MMGRNRFLTLSLSLCVVLLTALAFSLGSGQARAQEGSGIAFPAAGSTVGGEVIVEGTAAVENFQRYEVYVKPQDGGDDSYAYIGGGEEQVVNGPLVVWNTVDLPTGVYTLRLRVVKADSNYDEYFVDSITVDQNPTPTATPIPTNTPVPPTATPTPALPTATATSVSASTTVTTTETDVESSEAVTVTETVTLEADLGLPVVVEGGDEAALRLLLRYLMAAFHGPTTEAITVSVGALPANLPVDIDLSTSASVVASVENQSEFGGLQLFLTALDATVDLGDEIRSQLLDEEFSVPESAEDRPDEVFLSSDNVAPSLFCSADGAIVVNVSELSLSGVDGAILLAINDVRGGPCEDGALDNLGMVRVLPRLLPPANTTVLNTSGGRSTDVVSAEAELRSALSAAEVSLAYETQLETEGWDLLEQESGNAFAWSAWEFVDDEGETWSATFYVARASGESTSYVASLRAVRQP